MCVCVCVCTSANARMASFRLREPASPAGSFPSPPPPVLPSSSTNYASTFTRGKNDSCWKFFKREAVVVQTREGVVVVESLEVGMAIQRVVVAKLLQ